MRLYTDTKLPIHLKLWTRETYIKPYSPSPGLPLMKSRVQEFLINCSTWQVALGPFTACKSDGDTIVSMPGTPTSFEDIAPDTVGEAIATAACGK